MGSRHARRPGALFQHPLLPSSFLNAAASYSSTLVTAQADVSPPEPLPAPLHWQLLQQPQESSVTTGTHCGHAHLQSAPSPWLQACGLRSLLSRRFSDGSTWYDLSPFTREALAHFILHNVVFPQRHTCLENFQAWGICSKFC